MNRGLVVKFVLGGLVMLAAVDSVQAGIIFRRGWRNDCCYDGYYGYGRANYGYRGNSYAYAMPVYSNAYVNNCCCQPTGTMMASGMMAAPYTSGYADPNAMTSSNASLTADKTRLRVQVPTAETQIWVDQHLVQSSGTNRSIDMPYSTTSPQKVTITAQWMKDGREVVRKKEVELRGGQEATIQFSDAEVVGEQIQTSPNGVPDASRPNPDKP